MRWLRIAGVCVFLAALSVVCCARQPPDNRVEALEISRVTRDVDLTSPLAKEKVTMVLENKGKKATNYVLYAVESRLAGNVAYISAEVQERGSDGLPAYVNKEQRPLAQSEKSAVYRLSIPSLAPDSSVTLAVEVVYSNAITAFPTHITQNEKQLVMFTGNSYFFSPYPSATQSSNFKLPNSKVESFTRVSPTNHAEETLTYGPYSDVAPFSSSKVNIHFENNGPFLTVVELERVIEVSHWGNIAVEEHVHIMHSGAVLKGSFSRYDFQRNPNSGPNSVKGFTTLLPAAARDIYYRDEIGNISTSNVRDDDDYVSFELKPRFPLFGGWQTRYYYGYNLPSYEYLYHHGNNYVLKMRLLDHIIDDQLIQKLTVKIILPEGAKNIDFQPPGYEVEEAPRELKLTYLDTIGRPVIVARATNLVEQHVQDFTLQYSFQSVMLLQEPLLIVSALLIFFLCVIIIVRLDFSITEDAALLARQQAAVMIESIQQWQDQRAALVARYMAIIDTFKGSKDTGGFKSSKKGYDDDYKKYSEQVGAKMKELQSGDPEAAAKVQEVQKKMSEVKSLLDECCLLAEKVVKENMKKPQYVEQSKTAEGKIDKILADVAAVMHTL